MIQRKLLVLCLFVSSALLAAPGTAAAFGLNPDCTPTGSFQTVYNPGSPSLELGTCASGDGFTLDDATAICGSDVEFLSYTCTDYPADPPDQPDDERAWTAYYECCVPPGPSCTDGIQDGNESDVDCGGSCNTGCYLGQTCNFDTDCASDYCLAGICATSSVQDPTCISDGNNVTFYSPGWPASEDGTCAGGFDGFTIEQAAATCSSGLVKYYDWGCTDFSAGQRTWTGDYACCAAPDVCTIDGTVYAAGQANPANSCQSCQPTVSSTAFTDNPYNGGQCDDGDPCTLYDVCTDGVCAGTSFTCAAPDPCHQPGTCNGDGTCTYVVVADGTACNDGNACTDDDVCTDGVCGGTPFSCAAPDPCHQPGTCNGDGTCSFADAYDGTVCNDGNPCTFYDVCTDGVCGGTPFSCAAPDPCHQPGTCNGDGTCSFASRANGTACNDGNACTSSDVCTGGVCGGTPYTCTRTVCQSSSTCDGNGGCTIVDQPSGSACTSDGNPCTSDLCDGSGNCTHPAVPPGTSCGTGEVCEGTTCTPECADLGLEKAGPATVVASTSGTQLTYTLVVSNISQATAVSPIVSDALPAGETYVSATTTSGSCSFASDTLTCALANMAPNGTATITLEVDVTAVGGSLTNTATVTSSTPDCGQSNNTSTSITQVTNGGATRTQGFYATHPNFLQACLTSLGGTMDIGWFVIGEYDAGGPVNNTPLAYAEGVMNGNVAKYVNGVHRSSLEHDKMIAAQQLVAAICNADYLGTPPPFDLDGMIAAMAGTNDALIMSYEAKADAFNNSGDNDNIAANPGPANPHYPWDDPSDPYM